MRARAYLVPVVVAAVALGGCGGDDPVGTTTPTTVEPADGTDVDTGEDTEVGSNEPAGDCAEHDGDGRCVDDPEEALEPDPMPPNGPDRPSTLGDAAAAARAWCEEIKGHLVASSEVETVGEVRAALDSIANAFGTFIDHARTLDLEQEARSQWLAALDELDEATEATTTWFRQLLAERSDDTTLDEVFADLDASQAPLEVTRQDTAQASIEELLGYSCFD